MTFIYHYVLEKKLDVTEADIEFSRLHSSMVLHFMVPIPLPSTHVLDYMDEHKRPENLFSEKFIQSTSVIFSEFILPLQSSPV